MQESTRPLLALLLLATFFYWASLPPVNVWFLAFVVPVIWSVLIRKSESLKFRYVYGVTFVFWLASIWWIACPHPLTTFGLLALAGYLSIYWPLFFAASRIAVHRFGVPVVLAAPICWVGCEFLRNHLLGGFSFCSLEHALYLKPKLLQIADLGGGYLVGAMIVAVGTGIGSLWPVRTSAQEPGVSAPGCAASPKKFNPPGAAASTPTPPALGAWASAAFGIAVLLTTAVYGAVRFSDSEVDKRPSIRVAALQGNIPVVFKLPPEYFDQVFEQFRDLTFQAAAEEKKPALIIWPETVCPLNNFEFRNGAKPEDIDLTEEQIAENQAQFGRMARTTGVPLLIGLSTLIFDGKPRPKRLNSAMYAEADRFGKETIGPRYDKVRLVMFGEYIPLSSFLPDDFFLKTICVEATPGKEPVAIPLDGMTPKSKDWAAVNICFESTIPHWIREQVLTLKRQGKAPRLLINISNDGWFWFSQQIDQHLATHVFRAIENRLPYVTATNGGFSAIIDDRGRILQIGKRGAAEAVVGDVKLSGIEPLYHRIGDWPPFVCSLLVLILLVLRHRIRD